MATLSKITPCLWFDSQGEAAANFYVSIFPDSKITTISRYGQAGHERHGREPGSVMVVAFELAGQSFTALNGGPTFTITEAISFQVNCDTQEEIDYYWDKLSEGGPVDAQVCGWLKDKFGVSWQIVPGNLAERMTDPAKSDKVMQAVLQMKKFDLAQLEAAAES